MEFPSQFSHFHAENGAWHLLFVLNTLWQFVSLDLEIALIDAEFEIKWKFPEMCISR